MITSRQNPHIKDLMVLAKKSKDSKVLAEGVHLLEEALKSGIEIEEVLLVPRRANDEVLAVIEKVRKKGIEIVEMSEDCYKKISQLKSSETVAMVYKSHGHSSEEFFTGNKKILVLENIQDPGNAGAMVRIAEATGMDGCVFVGGASITNGKFLRACMGAVFRVPCLKVEMDEFLTFVKGNDFRLIVTELNDKATPFMEANYDTSKGGIGVCFGSEGKGISQEMLGAADSVIYIPMAGEVESLNVAVAAGIVLYHAGS